MISLYSTVSLHAESAATLIIMCYCGEQKETGLQTSREDTRKSDGQMAETSSVVSFI